MSQEQLAKLIGRDSASAVYYIEQGDRRIKVLDLIAIAKAFGVSMDTILFGERQTESGHYSVSHEVLKHVSRGSTLTGLEFAT